MKGSRIIQNGEESRWCNYLNICSKPTHLFLRRHHLTINVGNSIYHECPLRAKAGASVSHKKSRLNLVRETQ